ncbi:FtsX-like permease family protein [Oceanimonas pelagia]|uniref:FtsX-like permease family protein n=1 Tax=Oceanimonas pelagia TaxID=3028314 RepID=A0AA50KLR4_9GAMM|nr:FtsX-like permease family protein [Oceanimonas pelagia]WMC09868.1 FtsX-like permease family protein [Oceanimonas pelagia]
MASLGWGLIGREVASGPLRLFVLALALCVASILSVTLVADRLNAALTVSGRDYIAADRVLAGSRPAEPGWLAEAQRRGLAVSVGQSFNSVLFASEQLQLASIRAVDDAFPFYGELVLAPAGKVRPGHIWLSARLLALLKVTPGEVVELGNLRLTVAGELVSEPDQGFSPFLLAPRALMHLDDVAATGIFMAGSRSRYRYLFKGDDKALTDYARWLQPRLQQGQRWRGPDNADTPVARSITRAEQFFRLASLTGVLLGILAMAIALGYFSRREQDRIALLKTLGAGRRQLLAWLGRLLTGLMLLGALLGAVAGYGVHQLILLALGDAMAVPLPPPSLRPFVVAAGLALLTTVMLSVVPLLRLLEVPPLRVLRNEAEARISPWLSAGILLAGTVALSWLFAGSMGLAAGLLLGLVALVLLLGTLCRGLLALARLPRGSVALRLALSRLERTRLATLLQFGGVALALFLASLLWVVRGELTDGFLARLPDDTHNRFLINIAEHELTPVRQVLADNGLDSSRFYPIVRGRLVQVNEVPVAEISSERGGGLGRELNLTWSAEAPEGNRIIDGAWSAAAGGVSVESGLAERLGLVLGDSLTLDLAGQTVSAEVRSIREVDWDSMKPNFYLVLSPDVLADYPAAWMASFYLPEQKRAVEVELIRAFPTITVFDVDALLQQLRTILAQVSQALLVIMALVTGASLLVLLAQVEATLESRRRELVLLRTLGAGSRLIRASLRWEWLGAGLVAGLAAALAVELCVAVLLPGWLDLPWQPHPGLWLALPALGAGLLLLTGRAGGLLRGVLMNRLRRWG